MTDDVSFADGSYISAFDFAPGLYTFVVEAGERGAMTVALDGFERRYEADGEAQFTAYLPDGAEITLEGGILRPAKDEQYFVEDEVYEYVGTGRLLIGSVGTTFYIRALEDSDEAMYEVSCLLYDEGFDEPMRIQKLAPGESAGVRLYPGDFILVVDCVLEATFSHG